MNGTTYLGHWPLSRSAEARELTDRPALFEARSATGDPVTAPISRPGLVARLRDALSGSSGRVDACACPA